MAENEIGPKALTDEELEAVNAAASLFGGDDDPLFSVKYVLDERGREIGKAWKKIGFYWLCPNCGRPTHTSLLRFWCDKCDASWSNIDMKMWVGTIDELLAAADAN